MSVVLDTCALLWLTLDPEQISLKGHKVISQADALLVSSISIWEIGVKWKAKKLDLGTSFEDYVARVSACRDFELVPVDARLWSKSVVLRWEHRDPADRVIIALAQERDSVVVTGDAELRRFYRRCVA